MAKVPVSKSQQVARSEEQFMVPRLELPNQTTAGRVFRRPAHKYTLRQRPWDLQPCFIAPVLPGETLKSLLIQSRTVSDPVKNPLAGWWCEYYVFYVKHTDLATGGGDGGTMVQMHLSNTDPASLRDGTARLHYYKNGATSCIDWVKLCMETIIPWYFRDDLEGLTGYNGLGVRSTTLYKAKIGDRMWMDSLKIADVNPAMNSDLPGVVSQLPPHMSAFQTHYDQWTYMRETKLTDASFEDYLAKFGVKVPGRVSETEHRPELIRYLRDWTYPSNTIDPVTGAPTAALSWATAERADKDRFFQEPGFLIGIKVVRPKVFFAKQKSPAVTMLDDAFGWLPALMREDPYTSLKLYNDNEGPLAGVLNAVDDYWVDRRDLFLYGDQFANYDISADKTVSEVLLPGFGVDNVLDLDYASDTDAQNLFVDDTNASGKTMVRSDGIVTLNILGHQRDQT